MINIPNTTYLNPWDRLIVYHNISVDDSDRAEEKEREQSIALKGRGVQSYKGIFEFGLIGNIMLLIGKAFVAVDENGRRHCINKNSFIKHINRMDYFYTSMKADKRMDPEEIEADCLQNLYSRIADSFKTTIEKTRERFIAIIMSPQEDKKDKPQSLQIISLYTALLAHHLPKLTSTDEKDAPVPEENEEPGTAKESVDTSTNNPRFDSDDDRPEGYEPISFENKQISSLEFEKDLFQDTPIKD